MKASYASALAWLVVCLLLGATSPLVHAQATMPRVFYTDLTSGPNSGGQNNKGVFVTAYGSGFGASQGSSVVTIGGAAADNYPYWSDTKITFQLGSAAVTGKIVVSVNGKNSNAITFTVRAGNIYFVSPTGSDSANGSYATPWQTLQHAQSAAVAGDTIYVMDGVQQVTPDANSAALTLLQDGTSSSPIALLAYPGATPTVGSPTGTQYGIYVKSAKSWVIGGLQITGLAAAVYASSSPNLRLVGNDISCPNATGSGACVNSRGANGAKIFGNHIHDAGAAGGANAAYQAVYGDANGWNVGWNEVAHANGCYGVQLWKPGRNLLNLTVHDNFIHDTVCSAASLPGVDVSRGAVKLYNNVIARAGTGPDPGNSSYFACLQVGGSGAGTVQITNNTLSDCGAAGGSQAGALAISTPAAFTDNIVTTTGSETYLAPATGGGQLSGSNDLFFGSGTAPSGLSATLNADPLFVAPASDNYRLQSTSPAIDHGATAGVVFDFDGVKRPQGTAYDIGAFEFDGTATTSPGQLTATPASLSFGSITAGGTATQSVTLSNTGGSPVTISASTVSGNGFSGGSLSTPYSLAAGATVALQVTFAPSAAGTYSGSLAISSDASNPSLSVPLSGTATTAATATLAANPTSIAFGSITSGTSATKSLTISNTGSASASISAVAASGTGFSVSNLATPYALAAGASVTLQVTFAPATTGTFSGAVTVSSDASNPSLSVPLSGSATTAATATLAATPTSINFGSVVAGTSTTQSLTISNTGNAGATISAVTENGGGFTVSNLATPYTLAAGANVVLQVTFAPTAAATYSGSVTVSSNASNPTLSVPLSGTGTAAAHWVALSWTDTATNIAGYNIYRSTTSGGPYTKITSSLVTATSYNDMTVVAGTTYYYVITAVDTNGMESAYSAQVTAVIPTP